MFLTSQAFAAGVLRVHGVFWLQSLRHYYTITRRVALVMK